MNGKGGGSRIQIAESRLQILDLLKVSIPNSHLKSCYENECPSPDSSGNPLCFFFKNIKIATNSWK
jgi:hypothetical protein